ncbi:MAG: hypothetical protein EXS13_11375 [Planctomycetes bacterium]|nr:hypothetical protein [Planctomycetota bacterium]
MSARWRASRIGVAVVIELDGSMGEGGGQLLRAALALSLATRQPFRMERISARRGKPGLLRQHLTCMQAAARIRHWNRR